MRVLVLHQTVDTSRADEADTLTQAQEITEQLRALGHDAIHVSASNISEMEGLLTQHQPEVAFNLVESLYSADRFAYLAPGLLEAMQIPYTGNSAPALMLASEKPALKAMLHAHGIAAPRGLEAGDETRYIVKSTSEHASLGLDADSVIEGTQAARACIALKTAQYGGIWMAEEYIDGREFNLSLLETPQGMLILPPAETVFEDFPADMPHIVDYRAKWDETSHAYRHTPRCFGTADAAIETLAQQVWKALGLRGYARIDIRVDTQDKHWVIDVNPNPCLSADAGFMAAASQHGMLPRDVIHSILDSSLHATSLRHTHAA